MNDSIKRAIILLSGGMDSATVLAVAQAEGYACYALSFAYGQRHAAELQAAKHIAVTLGAAEHRIATIDLRIFGASALTDNIEVPKHRSAEAIAHGIPVTYVPARNTIFLAYALAYAEVVDARDIFIGVNALDYSGYPDCRPEYIAAFQKLATLATAQAVTGTDGVTIHAPLQHLTKAEIIARGGALGVDYAATLSCYDPSPDGRACGACDACSLRKKGFAEAGIPDPTLYDRKHAS